MKIKIPKNVKSHLGPFIDAQSFVSQNDVAPLPGPPHGFLYTETFRDVIKIILTYKASKKYLHIKHQKFYAIGSNALIWIKII